MKGIIRVRIYLLLIFVLPQAFVNSTIWEPDAAARFFAQLEKHTVSRSDVVFLLESSGFVDSSEFAKMKSLTARIVQQFFRVAEHQDRVAVISFSTEAVTSVNYITNARGENLCTVLKEIGEIGYQGEYRYTYLAMEQARNIFQKARPDSEKIVVLLTNGLDMLGSKPFVLADELKSQGVVIFVIGLEDVSEKIKEMATSVDHSLLAFEVSDIETEMVQGISTDFCGSACSNNSQCHCETETGNFKCICNMGFFKNPSNSFECLSSTSLPEKIPEKDDDVSRLRVDTSKVSTIDTAPTTATELTDHPTQLPPRKDSGSAKIDYSALDEVDLSLPFLGKLIKSLPHNKRLPKIMELLNNVYASVEKQ